MRSLPERGPDVHGLGLPLPPARMAPLRAGRPLKRWRYVGVYRADVMLCVGAARVAGVPQRWWAVALPDGRLVEGRRGVRLADGRVEAGDAIQLQLEEGDGVEVVSPHGRSYVWTRKQAPVRARGVGRTEDGRRVAWNFIDGVHDGAPSERTLWIDGEAREVAPQEFAADLSRVGELDFREWSARMSRTNLGIVRNSYRQPFGEFSGRLPGGLRLAEGYGVMEEHDVLW